MLNLRKPKPYISHNHNERFKGRPPSIIVIHYTGMATAEEALSWLCAQESKVSAHYVIEENGTIHNLVHEDKRAWHAGLSYWEGETDINALSIGIELVNPGAEFGYRDFPPDQMQRLESLCLDLMGRYNIHPARVLGHSDIAPGRKIDPGERFPWQALAAKGVGLWPKPKPIDMETAEQVMGRDQALIDLFTTYGYNPDVDPELVITEFHRHFAPEKFRDGGNPAKADKQTVINLLSLIRQKQTLT